jgi:hypothetical protein
VTLQEVKFENGSVGASSIYDSSASFAAENAFLQGSDSIWNSGRDANGQGELAFAYPHIIWYNFQHAFLPGRVSFRPRRSSKYCLVKDDLRESFKCLGISVLESSYTGKSEVSVNGIRMGKRKI